MSQSIKKGRFTVSEVIKPSAISPKKSKEIKAASHNNSDTKRVMFPKKNPTNKSRLSKVTYGG